MSHLIFERFFGQTPAWVAIVMLAQKRPDPNSSGECRQARKTKDDLEHLLSLAKVRRERAAANGKSASPS